MERLSGATTDLQHIVHQGMSYYGSTFWVGANAVIRKRALDDIVEIEHQGGFEIRRYVMDRTVIEDTESSIDLAIHGWKLLNYPERLSYSATPPDFGSLCIQRRRWANGGLIILPKLWQLRRARLKRAENSRTIETLLRVNYLASTCWSSIALVLLLVYPFNSQLLSPLVLLAALPYFIAMSSDLKRCGYKRMDIFRVYGFNLILLPVNLAGVVKSIQQADHRSADPVRPHPQGREPDRDPVAVRHLAVPDHRLLGVHRLARCRQRVLGQRDVRRVQRDDGHLRAGGPDGRCERAGRHLARLRGAAVRDRQGRKPKWSGCAGAGRNRNRRRRPGRTCSTGAQPATATGEHIAEGTGMFRILAEVPEAAGKHNRRATDRTGRPDRPPARPTGWTAANGPATSPTGAATGSRRHAATTGQWRPGRRAVGRRRRRQGERPRHRCAASTAAPDGASRSDAGTATAVEQVRLRSGDRSNGTVPAGQLMTKSPADRVDVTQSVSDDRSWSTSGRSHAAPPARQIESDGISPGSGSFLVVAVVAGRHPGVVVLHFASPGIGRRRRGDPTSWFAPYVDVTPPRSTPSRTATGRHHLDGAGLRGQRHRTQPCEPSWGGAYSMAAAGGRASTSTAGSPGCGSSAARSRCRSAEPPTPS